MKKKNSSSKKIENLLRDADAALSAQPKDVKVRVTTMIDLDIIDELKNLARRSGVGYQTILNMKLREIVLGETIVDKNVIKSINEKINKLEKKVELLSKRA